MYKLDSNAKEITCQIIRAKYFEILFANLNHPNQGLRAAFKLGIISLILSIISLIK